ncbi:MAG: gliding motility-associated C-terminal domain-containing protein [Saprospiraceae bacterium]|jgi:hypothetical protein|nr:gliding motility-associated C-terminal domain-containing protein [Saprospiraceae bacterium]
MHKLLILLLFCFSATIANAQVPTLIKLAPTKPDLQPVPDAACSVGTFTFGPILGESNDNVPDTLFFCFGDSMCIQHNGDAMYMDPDPSTPPGIGYAFYRCPPTGDGDEMAVLGDPCLWPGAAGTGFFATIGPADGSHCFFNSGSLVNSPIFGQGNPVAITFAPITITDFAGGMLEPGCVDVGIAQAFTVVYLEPIDAISIVTNFNDDCKGKFRVLGGYPQWDLNATYTVSIYLTSDPAVKALIYTPPAQITHFTDVIFSVPQSGNYTVVIEDGKSCGHTFQINMANCNPLNNVIISMPDLLAPPASQICVPVTVNNFDDIIGSSFSLTWDPTMLQYTGIQNPHPAIQPFGAVNGNLNENDVLNGFLGVVYSDFASSTTIPDDDILFEICFTVLAPLDSCSTIDVVSFPSIVTMDDAFGGELAVTVNAGSVCAGFNPLVIDAFVDTTYCNNTATLGVAISGGDGPYEIIWRTCAGAVGGQVVSNVADTILTLPVPEDCWEICVTDQNGFGTQVCETVNVAIPSLGATLALVQSPTCNGASNGSVRADVTIDGVLIPNPGPGFMYLWNTVPPQVDQTISGIPAGGYSVTVTDVSTGCTQVAAGTLSQPPAITMDPQVTPATCPGIADGSITVTTSGGTPGAAGSEYLYFWEYAPDCNGPYNPDDAGSGNPFVLTGKLPGGYRVTVTDANGCTYVHPVCIEITSVREVTIDTVNIFFPSCFGLSNGSVEAAMTSNPAFNNPSYLFFWNPIAPMPPGPYPTNNVGNVTRVSGLPAGMIELIALEVSTGCTAGAKFTLSEPPVLDVALVSQTNPTCLNPTTGAITVAGSGGTPNYTYTWSSTPPAVVPALPNLTNLGPAVYTVTISDINGCLDSLTVPLPLPNPPTITSIDSVSVTCGFDGSLQVNAPAAVSFEWTTLGGVSVGNTAQVSNLPGGTYIVTVRDAQGCANTDTVTLAGVTPLFLADSLLTRPTCFGDSDGSIAIDVQGGNPNYLYNWAPGGQNTAVIFAIPAGTYTVTVTDSRGCTLVRTFTLANPPGISLSQNQIVPASCPGACDGGVTLVVSYAGTPADFNFLWEDGSTDSVRTDLCPGYNSVTVTDASKNCFRIDSVLIAAPPDFVATFSNDSVSCFGATDGRSAVTVTGGNGLPYTYLWSSGATLPTAANLPAGPISLTVTDNSGCTQVFVTQIEEPAQIIATKDQLNSRNPLCFGGNTGTLALTVTGGTGNYTFSWANAAGPITDTSNPLDNLSSGTYSVTVTDDAGCTAVQTGIILSDPAPVQGAYLPWEPILCFGEETTLFIDTITGGAGDPYQYSLDFGVYLDPGFPINMGGGEHYITYVDRLGCEYTDTIFVQEPAPITVIFDPNEVEIELGDSLQLIPIISGATVTDFDWTPPTLLSNPDTLEPFTRTYESQEYTLVVYDANGCSATGSIQINVDPNRNVYIPNAFIPGNVKGLNDHFNLNIGRGVEIVNYMRIFDRWGNLMYQRESFIPNNNDFAEGWDGKYKGQIVQNGVYVYLIEVKFLDGRVLLYRGDVSVLR